MKSVYLMVENKELEYKFIERTGAHIKRVIDNGERLCEKFPEISEELRNRIAKHDTSKFGPFEFDGYIFVTEKYRPGNQLNITPDIQKLMDDAIKNHYKSNRHHPEYHEKVEDMSELDLAEMVCDWAAMSQEMNDKLDKFYYKNALPKHKFTEEQQKSILKYINCFPELLTEED
ncbi:MAG: DUF5662 family protein [Melioribacteraceae bacterium]|nr:DUF5662 family protein [Melioribacteraceae bacterium]